MVTKNEFFGDVHGAKNTTKVDYAQVGALADNGEPLLRFVGEQAVGRKIYPRLASYNDADVGDRVIVLNGIILGRWVHNAEQDV